MPMDVQTLQYTGNILLPYYNAEEAQRAMTRVGMVKAASGTVEYKKGTILGKVTASGLYDTYADSDTTTGLGVAAVILERDISVDVNGLITYASTAGLAGELGVQDLTALVYTRGYFRSESLVGLDAAGLTDMGGRVLMGTITAGVVYIP